MTNIRLFTMPILMLCFTPLSAAQNAGRIPLGNYPQSAYPTLAAKIAQGLKDCRAVGGSCVLEALDQVGNQDLGAFDPGPDPQGVTLLLGKGNYSADSITLRPALRIVGLNEIQTIIQAKKTTTDLVVLPPGGPVHNAEISSLTLSGVPSASQRAIYLNAQRSGPPAFHGGLWFSQFRNLKIVNFTGDNITIRGSQDDWWGPMQWLTWENVIVWRPNDTSHYALKITGETGQIRFMNCQFDSNSPAPPPRGGVGVFIGQESGAKVWPVNVQFDLATIQGWGKAAVISHADNIHFITPHLEGDDSLFDVIKGSRAFVAEAGLAWTNACMGGKAKSGYCFFVDSSSNAAFRDFTICCTPDQIMKAESGAHVVLSNNSSWSVPAKPDDPTLGEETILKGRGSATGSCTPGQLYTNVSGGSGSTLYVCEGGMWKAK